MKAKTTRRIIALVLSVVMVLAIIPAVFAADFSDVPAGQWYKQYVDYCVDNGLMSGTSATTFNPMGTVTREMAVQTLYAMAGKPAAEFSPKFSDVKAGMWYTDAIMWAVEYNITSGMDGGKFGVGVNVTREQIALFFNKYAIYAGMEEDWANIDSFPDAGKVSSWAKDAVRWAVKFGILSGKGINGVNYLKPQDPLTRAELAAMLTSFHKIVPAACEHDIVLTGAKAATCTEDGYTGDMVCSKCGFEQSKGEVIPAIGHNYVDGQCVNCGEVDPDFARQFVLTDEIVGGKQYILYNPGHGMIVKNENSKDWNLVPVEMTPTDDKFVEEEPGALDEFVWTLIDNGDGTYSFVNGENKIVMWISGTYFEITNNADYPESDGNWKILPADAASSLYFIQHATFSNSYGPAYIECFTNKNGYTNIAGYSSGNPAKSLDDFGFQFYGFGKACEHLTTEEVKAVAPTCTEPGSTAGVKCANCGKILSGCEVIPATGHNYVDGKCSVCGKEQPTGEEVVIYYPKESKVMTTASKEYTSASGTTKLELCSANASLVDGKVITAATDVAKFIMTEEDGVVTFATADGKYLYADGTHVKLVDAEDDNTKFVLEEVDGGVYIRCATAQFSGKAQYIEFYAGVFTVFSMGTDPSIYTFGLYPLGEGDLPVGEEKEFIKVTEDLGVWDGTYVAAYDISDSEAVVFNGIVDSDQNIVKAAKSGDTITAPIDCAIEIEASGDGYTFKTKAGYLDGKTVSGAAANGTTFSAEAKVGSVSWDAATNSVKLQSAAGTILRYNNGSVYEGEGNYSWFRFFKVDSSVQTPIALYRLNEGPVCEHEWEKTSETAATCTAAGKIVYTCKLCNRTKTETIPATGHNYVDGVCTNCGKVQPSASDLVAIYFPGESKVMTTEEKVYNGKLELCAADAELNDGTVSTEAENVALFSQVDNGDGTVTFATADGKYLYADSKDVKLVDAEGEFTKFVLEEVEGGVYIRCATANYSGKAQYIEFYAGVFTVYGMGANTAIYTFGIYPVAAACAHEWEKTSETAATCTEAGSIVSTCKLCGKTKTENIPALGHNYVDGVCSVCGYVKPEGSGYVKVTSDPADWSGEYLIVYEAGDGTAKVFNGKDATGEYVTLDSITDNTIEFQEGMCSVVVEKMDGGYSVKVGDQYMSEKAVDQNGTTFSATPKATTFACNDDGTVTMTCNTCIFRFNKNAGDNNDRFRYYKASSTSFPMICLYKLGG